MTRSAAAVKKRQVDKPSIHKPAMSAIQGGLSKKPEEPDTLAELLRVQGELSRLQSMTLNQRKVDSARLLELLSKSMRNALFSCNNPEKIDQICKKVDEIYNQLSAIL